MKKITILITDDHPLVRKAWCFILNSDDRFMVIAEASSGEEAVQLAVERKPDVIIMDINLPGMSGIETTRKLCGVLPGAKILGISMHADTEYMHQMIRNGAMGYITKYALKEEIFKAILEITMDRQYISEELKEVYR